MNPLTAIHERLPRYSIRRLARAMDTAADMAWNRAYFAGYRAAVADARKLAEIRQGEHGNAGNVQVRVSGTFAQSPAPPEPKPPLKLVDDQQDAS